MSKIALSLKLDSDLLKEANEMTQKLHIPRSRAIEEGLRLWVAKKTRAFLAQEMKAASLAIRSGSLKEAKEWESTLADGLENE